MMTGSMEVDTITLFLKDFYPESLNAARIICSVSNVLEVAPNQSAAQQAIGSHVGLNLTYNGIKIVLIGNGAYTFFDYMGITKRDLQDWVRRDYESNHRFVTFWNQYVDDPTTNIQSIWDCVIKIIAKFSGDVIGIKVFSGRWSLLDHGNECYESHENNTPFCVHPLSIELHIIQLIDIWGFSHHPISWNIGAEVNPNGCTAFTGILPHLGDKTSREQTMTKSPWIKNPHSFLVVNLVQQQIGMHVDVNYMVQHQGYCKQVPHILPANHFMPVHQAPIDALMTDALGWKSHFDWRTMSAYHQIINKTSLEENQSQYIMCNASKMKMLGGIFKNEPIFTSPFDF